MKYTSTKNILMFNRDKTKSLKPRKSGHQFAGDILNAFISLNENFRILIEISLKVILMSPIDNKSALVNIMASCQSDENPLSESMTD